MKPKEPLPNLSKTSSDPFRTGEVCLEAGRYAFVGYLDHSVNCLPLAPEGEISMHLGDTFPPRPENSKPCFWRIVGAIKKEPEAENGIPKDLV